MGRFYLRLWADWVVRLSLESVIGAFFLTLGVVGYFYVKKGMPELSDEVSDALVNIFRFWFSILWSVAFLAALFRGVKYFFNKCYNGFVLHLFSCSSKERIEPVGYGDLIKVWRRWFMLLIWITAAFIVVRVIVGHFLFGIESVFSWLGLPELYAFVVAAGFFAIVLSTSMCKRVKVELC